MIRKSLRRQICLAAALLMIGAATSLFAGTYLNSITFENGTDEFAVVKLVGPSSQVIEVASGANAMTHVPPGEYYIVVRYGRPGHYSYTKGDPFTVVQYGNRYSVIRITLHKVVDGNYHTRPAGAEEFDGR